MEIQALHSLPNEDRILLSAVYNKNFPFSFWSQEYFLSFLSDTSRSSLGFFIKQDTAPAGFVLGRLLSEQSATFCLSTLWIDKAFRGNGYGERLVQKLINTITTDKEIKKIILHFRDANDLKDYYSRLGFSNHQICGTYSNGDPKHYMELELSQRR